MNKPSRTFGVNMTISKQIVRKRKHRSAEEWVPVAEKLAEKIGGILPNPQWLLTHGYGALHVTIWKHPELFKHIKQMRKHSRSPEELLPLAEKLA